MKPYSVKLELTQDEDGTWGLLPDGSDDYGFNSFWTGVGIFHDVFEHYFEMENKYFMGDYAFNIGGEIAAMGHLAYYKTHFDISKRSSRYIDDQSLIDTTFDHDFFYGHKDYPDFGDILMSKVPRVRKSLPYGVENLINEHHYRVKEIELKTEAVIRYKKSFTYGKIRDLYAWGFNRASKIIPRSDENRPFINEFCEYWDNFCKKYTPEELEYGVNAFVFRVYPGEKARWTVKVQLKENYELISMNKFKEDCIWL